LSSVSGKNGYFLQVIFAKNGKMDRIDAIKVFVAAVDEQSLSGAARRLGRSPAAVTRFIAFLEDQVGVELLHRTTRSVRLSEAGERYIVACRRILAEFEEANLAAAGAHAAPHGLLTVTAPVMFGTRILRPIVDDFLAAHPTVQVRYLLLDRQVSLTDEGIDIGLRIAHLPDSSLIVKPLGSIRRVVVASPRYLADRPLIQVPADLAQHDCITHGEPAHSEVWHFPPAAGAVTPRHVRIYPRLHVNLIESAIRTAADGRGVVRVLSYQIEQELSEGRLTILLDDAEPDPIPVQFIVPEGRLGIAKVRAFIDFTSARLRERLRAGEGEGSTFCEQKVAKKLY
jgi:DNA-binding transcriptional LysR family regulator